MSNLDKIVKAQKEAFKIKEKAEELKGLRGDKGEPKSCDYEAAFRFISEEKKFRNLDCLDIYETKDEKFVRYLDFLINHPLTAEKIFRQDIDINKDEHRKYKETVERFINILEAMVKFKWPDTKKMRQKRSDLAMKLFKRLSQEIASFVRKDENIKILLYTLDIYKYEMLDSDDHSLKEFAENMMLTRYLDIIIDKIKDCEEGNTKEELSYYLSDVLIMLYEKGQFDSEALGRFNEIFKDAIYNGKQNIIESIIGIVDGRGKASDSARVSIKAMVSEVVSKFLLSNGLPNVLFANWLRSGPEDHWSSFIPKNLKRIAEIEKEKPGICSFLYKNFGIMDFGRYPKEILVRQFEEFDNRVLPYGVIINPRYDHNGAFYRRIKEYSDLNDQLGGKFLLRVAECESRFDFAKTIIKFDRKYNFENKGPKISLLIIGGHGRKDKISFGGEDGMHCLLSEDLMGKGARRSAKFFEENLTIILISCHTGLEGGIGQELSEKLGARILAPTGEMTGLYITAKRSQDHGKYDFEVLFRGSAQNEYKQGLISK